MQGGAAYVKALYEIGKITTELLESGIQLKDYERGLIDFPCMRDGRVVLLCWQLGEAERIESVARDRSWFRRPQTTLSRPSM